MCFWCKANTLTESTEEQSQNSLQECFVYIQVRTKLEDLSCKIYGQSRAQQQYDMAKDHYQNAMTTRVKCKDQTWTRSVAKVSESKAEPDDIAKYGTTSRPRSTSRTIPSTNAQKQNEKHFGAAIGSQTSTRRGRVAAGQKNPEYSVASQSILERSHAR